MTRKIAVTLALALLTSSGVMAAQPNISTPIGGATQSLSDKLLHREQKQAQQNCRAEGKSCVTGRDCCSGLVCNQMAGTTLMVCQ